MFYDVFGVFVFDVCDEDFGDLCVVEILVY